MAESQDHAVVFDFLSKLLPAAQYLNKKHASRVRLFRFWRLTPLAGTSNVSQTQQKAPSMVELVVIVRQRRMGR